MVAPGGGDFQRPLDVLLALDVGKVRQGFRSAGRLPGRGGGDGLPAGQMGEQLLDALHRVDLQALGQSGLRGVVRRDKEPLYPQRPGGQGHGQHAPHRAHLAGEAHLPHKGAPLQRGVQTAGGLQDAQQNGQVVHRALLAPVGGGEVDGDPGDREFAAHVADGGPHPLLGLLDGGVGQPHQLEGGQTPGQIALHPHPVALNALQAQ